MKNSSQLIEDFKQNLTEINEKYHQRQYLIDQLNNEITQLKQKCEQSDIRLQQYQVYLRCCFFWKEIFYIFFFVKSINDSSTVNIYEQQIDDLKKTLALKTNEIEAVK